jgi:signal transduction histidine kinase
MPLDLAQADLAALLRPAVAELGPPPDGVEVAYDLPDRPVTVRCDRNLMARVVANLVGNAYKFTPKGGRIRLGVTTPASRVRLEIDDNGPGVPRELRDRIFEKFGQGELGRAATRRSSGLGLTFCKLAVEAHGGAIGVDDAPGSGARFWIDLPAGSESA